MIRSFGLRGLLRPVALMLACSVTPGFADEIFHEDFDDGFAGWSTTGDVSANDSTALVPSSLRLRGASQASRTIATFGFREVEVSAFLAGPGSDQGQGVAWPFRSLGRRPESSRPSGSESRG